MALEPNTYTPTQTANKLWFCCCKEIQHHLKNVGITPNSPEAGIIDKVMDLAVKAVNSLLNLRKYFKMSQKDGKNVRQYVAHLKGAADQCNFTVVSGHEAISYVDQMVLGQLGAGLRDKQITREILEEAATKGLQSSKLQLSQVKKLVQVKKQAKEEAAQLNMENDMEVNRAGDKAPGKVKSNSHANPGGRNQPYVKGRGVTSEKCGRCARQYGKEVQCPATGVACFN